MVIININIFNKIIDVEDNIGNKYLTVFSIDKDKAKKEMLKIYEEKQHQVKYLIKSKSNKSNNYDENTWKQDLIQKNKLFQNNF